MGRLLTISGIMAILIAFSFFTVYTTNHTKTELNNLLDEAEMSAENNDLQKATDVTQKIENVWKEQKNLLLIFTNHEEINEMTEIVMQLRSLIQYENKAEFFSKLNAARETLSDIYSFQLPNIQNII